MDEVDSIIEGMERELEEHQAEISALGDRLSAGQNGVWADLNAAIRREDQLRSHIFDLKREYDRFTPLERAQLHHSRSGCGTPSGPPRSREEILACEGKSRNSRWKPWGSQRSPMTSRNCSQRPGIIHAESSNRSLTSVPLPRRIRTT